MNAAIPALETEIKLLIRNDRDAVATLTLNRPTARNALSRALMTQLQEQCLPTVSANFVGEQPSWIITAVIIQLGAGLIP